jgi:hypothetical protein
VTSFLSWLGGGSPREITDPADAAGYRTAGFLVALNVLLTWAVLGAVIGGTVAGWVVTVAAGLSVGGLGRALASSAADAHPARRALREVGGGLVAVLVGLVLGELAALAVLVGSPVGQPVNALLAQRAGLDRAVADAAARRDQALVIARCEYHPGPGCPTNEITGVPGAGPQARQADAALAAEERNLAAARDRRDAEAPLLDARIGQALGGLDDGLTARWSALNGTAPLAPRVAIDAVFVLVNLLPLLLRLGRGQTELDRDELARRVRRRAERDAGTQVAVHRAQVAAALELRRQDRVLAGELPSADPASTSVSATETRSVDPRPAELPSVEAEPVELAEPTEPVRPGWPDSPAEPAARTTELERVRAAGPVPAVAEAAPVSRRPLDVLPGPLPTVARTVTGLVRPLVLGPVARLAAAAPNPLRTARTVFREVEEFTFIMRRTRTVSVAEEAEGPAEDPSAVPIAAEVGTAPDDEAVEPARAMTVVEQLVPRAARLPGMRRRTGLDEPRPAQAIGEGRRQLPPAE